MDKEITYTGSIPQCPYCDCPTVRREAVGSGSVTCMYFPPTYNEAGENINPDRNISTYSYWCEGCKDRFEIAGNRVDGYHYVL